MSDQKNIYLPPKRFFGRPFCLLCLAAAQRIAHTSRSLSWLGELHTPYSKMAAASDDLGRVARERGIEGHDSMFTSLHVVV